MDLNGKVAVVTGASRGIGKAIALELARRGCDIAIAARTVTPRSRIPGTLGDTVEAVEALGRRIVSVRADLSEEADLQSLYDTTMTEFGRCDILVNNAALTDRLVFASLAETDRAGLERYLAVNLIAPFQLMKLFAEDMKKSGSGIIINITSGAADHVALDQLKSLPDEGTVYGTSKAALNRLTNAVARQLAEYRIPVIAVDPGSTQTEVWHYVQSQKPDGPSMGGHPVEWPARHVAYLITCGDPMQYSGTVSVTEEFVPAMGLA